MFEISEENNGKKTPIWLLCVKINYSEIISYIKTKCRYP